MSQWTHIVGTVYLYDWIDPKKQVLEFMESNLHLIPEGSEEPVEYFYNAGNRITASLGENDYVKGTGSLTFIGDLRDMSEPEFCEGFDKFIKKLLKELSVRDLTFMIKDEWRPTYKHYYMYGDELRIEDISKQISREP